jgi:catechol 2,3-dioxygenase-like lactoylglutathione lyase family enzyme
MISKVDFVGVPSTDAERSRAFYVETLGLRPDEQGRLEFAPQKNAHPALHVDDVAAAREELEGRGVEFFGDILDTGVCHMAFFTDPDGNDLMLHHRYAPHE